MLKIVEVLYSKKTLESTAKVTLKLFILNVKKMFLEISSSRTTDKKKFLTVIPFSFDQSTLYFQLKTHRTTVFCHVQNCQKKRNFSSFLSLFLVFYLESILSTLWCKPSKWAWYSVFHIKYHSFSLSKICPSLLLNTTWTTAQLLPNRLSASLYVILLL